MVLYKLWRGITPLIIIISLNLYIRIVQGRIHRYLGGQLDDRDLYGQLCDYYLPDSLGLDMDIFGQATKSLRSASWSGPQLLNLHFL